MKPFVVVIFVVLIALLGLAEALFRHRNFRTDSGDNDEP